MTKIVWEVQLEGDLSTLTIEDLNVLEEMYDFPPSLPIQFSISRVEMTQEEFDALPDFEGW